MLTWFIGSNDCQGAVYNVQLWLDDCTSEFALCSREFNSDMTQLGPFMSLAGFSRGFVLIVLLPRESMGTLRPARCLS